MKTIRFNLVTKGQEYEVNGEKKTNWNSLGKVVVFIHDDKDPSAIVELNHMPGHYTGKKDKETGEVKRVWENPVIAFVQKDKNEKKEEKVETYDEPPEGITW